MEIHLFNFGPIKEVAFDLSKDLSIIYGRNNVGKSYTISVIYLVLKALLRTDRFHLEKLVQHQIDNNISNRLKNQILGENECKITDKINNILEKVLDQAYAAELENSLVNSFGKLELVNNVKIKSPPTVQLNIADNMIRFEVGRKVRVKKVSLAREVFGKFTAGGQNESGIAKKSGDYFLQVSEETDLNLLLRDFVFDTVVNQLLKPIEKECGNLYFFPASRSVIYTSMQSLVPIMAELSQHRAHVTRKIELPGIPEPIADYISRLSKIRGIPTPNSSIGSIVSFMEEKILGGEIGFETDNGHLTYSPMKSGLTLAMSSVSSMVSELSPFVAFLKYILDVDRKPVIFIEEPEAHLHPEAQVLLAEMFLKLTQAGLKLVITSHSNYLFNKFANMLIARTLSPGKFAPIVLKNTRDGSIGRVMETDHLGIEDENFIDTADSLYEERELIMEKLNRESDDQ